MDLAQTEPQDAATTGTERVMDMRGIGWRRAELVVRCACDILGIAAPPPDSRELRVPINVEQFGRELTERYGKQYPELVFRTESSIERARLERRAGWSLPKVILLQGAPRRSGG